MDKDATTSCLPIEANLLLATLQEKSTNLCSSGRFPLNLSAKPLASLVAVLSKSGSTPSPEAKTLKFSTFPIEYATIKSFVSGLRVVSSLS